MRMTKLAGAAIAALGVAVLAVPHVVHADMAATMKMLDPDADGTVSLDEAQAAAAKKFATLDPDNDGTIDKKEAKGVIKKGAFKKADPDQDGTIDKTEYAALVEALFKKADPDGDGTLDAKELSSKPGGKLLALMN